MCVWHESVNKIEKYVIWKCVWYESVCEVKVRVNYLPYLEIVFDLKSEVSSAKDFAYCSKGES